MGQLIAPDEVPLWIPGELTLNSATTGREYVVLKGYRYGSLDVAIPSTCDYMIVNYKGSDVAASRRAGGLWCSEQAGHGVCSLLTRGEPLQQRWDRLIDAIHLYVVQTELRRAVEGVFEHSISDVGMEGCVRVKDSTLPSLASASEEELRSGGLGGNLYRSALADQFCTHLPRCYVKTCVREVPLAVRTIDWQRRRLDQHIEDNLDCNFKLEEMVGEAGASIPGLVRKFHVEFGCSPHAYVSYQRPE